MRVTKDSNVEEEFTQFWKEKGDTASAIMSGTGKYIILVPGKTDRTYRNISPAVRMVQGAVVLSKWGLSRTSLINDQLGSGQPLTPAQAIKAFNKTFPGQSFMERVRKGYEWLFE